MSEPPLQTLARWEDHGGVWRLRSLDHGDAVVDLCSCTGELMDVLRSNDPELVRALVCRPSSEHGG